jgi:hypothetical protein
VVILLHLCKSIIINHFEFWCFIFVVVSFICILYEYTNENIAIPLSIKKSSSCRTVVYWVIASSLFFITSTTSILVTRQTERKIILYVFTTHRS